MSFRPCRQRDAEFGEMVFFGFRRGNEDREFAVKGSECLRQAGWHFGDSGENDFFECGGKFEIVPQGAGAGFVTQGKKFFFHQGFKLGEVFPAISLRGVFEKLRRGEKVVKGFFEDGA